MKIILVSEATKENIWIWKHKYKPVKLWELFPCEDLSKYTKEAFKSILEIMYRVKL